jgi:hypothetical protein
LFCQQMRSPIFNARECSPVILFFPLALGKKEAGAGSVR